MGKDPSEIRREIEETRARMGDTVEALGYKADVPSRVKDAVNERVETVKGTIGSVVDSVKETLTGAGGKVGNALGSAKRSASQTLSDTTERLQDTTSDVRNSVQTNLSYTVGNVADKVGSVADKLPDTGGVTAAARRGAGIVKENPLGLALGALAVGFLAGLAAPISDLEREKVGPLRDDLVERAKSVTSDALEHGKQVLQETAQAAMGSVQQHGQQVLDEAKGDTVHGQQNDGDQNAQNGKSQGADKQGASAAGMPSDASQGGGLRGETLVSGGTGSQTKADKGKTSSEYGVLLDEDDDTLEPGTPGTASP